MKKMNYWVKIQFNALIFYTNYDFFVCLFWGVDDFEII